MRSTKIFITLLTIGTLFSTTPSLAASNNALNTLLAIVGQAAGELLSTNPSEATNSSGASNDLLTLAKQGDLKAQQELAYKYWKGEDVPQDYQQSLKWYQQCANQGYAGCQNDLGAMYYDGAGVPQSYQQAVSWYKKAADQGDKVAQHNMGSAYYKGEGIAKNLTLAQEYFTKACNQGYLSSCKALENHIFTDYDFSKFIVKGKPQQQATYQTSTNVTYKLMMIETNGSKKMIREFNNLSSCESLRQQLTQQAMDEARNLLSSRGRQGSYNLGDVGISQITCIK